MMNCRRLPAQWCRSRVDSGAPNPLTSVFIPLALGACAAELWKLALRSLASHSLGAAVLPSHTAPVVALVVLVLVVTRLLSYTWTLPRYHLKPPAAAHPAASAIVAAARRWLRSLYDTEARRRLGFGAAVEAFAVADAPRIVMDRGWWRLGCRVLEVRRTTGRGGFVDDAADVVVQTSSFGSRQRLPRKQLANRFVPNLSGDDAAAVSGAEVEAAVASEPAAAVSVAAAAVCRSVRRYVPLTRLSCTRVKIHGAVPELIAAGYRERIAAAVAAAGQQLEGVYVRRGCIELSVDSRVLQIDTTDMAAAAPVQYIDINELVQSLQLPQSDTERRSLTATVWHLPQRPPPPLPLASPSASASALEWALTLEAAEVQKRSVSGNAAAAPILTVFPCVVCTDDDGPAAVNGDDGGGSDSSARAAATAATSAWAGAAAAAAAAAASHSRCLALQVLLPLPPPGVGSEAAPPPLPTPVVSARFDGVFLPVDVEWRNPEVVRVPGDSRAVGSPTASNNRRCIVFSGTCRLRHLKTRASGLLLLQASCAAAGGGAASAGGGLASPTAVGAAAGVAAEMRPVPVLVLDDPAVAGEVCSATGAAAAAAAAADGDGASKQANGDEEYNDDGSADDAAVEAFIVDLGIFLGGAQRCRCRRPTQHSHEGAEWEEREEEADDGKAEDAKVSELETLGRHLEMWMRGSGPGAWTATLERLRRDMAAIAQRRLETTALPPPPAPPGEERRRAVSEAESGVGGEPLLLPPGHCHSGSGLDEETTHGSGGGGGSSPSGWLGREVAAGGAMYDLYDSCLMDSGYQEYLTSYCGVQAPALDVMFFASVGSVLLRTWQEDPSWSTRPPLAFAVHVAPCLLTLLTSLITAATRPAALTAPDRRRRWAVLARSCMLPRALCFLSGLVLLGSGLCGAPPPAIAAYHQRTASVLLGEGLVLSATLVIMPTAAAFLAAIRIPAHVAVWIRVGAYDTITAAVPYAVALAMCSVATNLTLHIVLFSQYRRRRRTASAAAAAALQARGKGVSALS